MIFVRVLVSALKGVFHYSGRSDRLEHWTFCLLTVVLGLFGYLYVDAGGELTPPILWVFLIFGTWFLLSHLALLVRRVHDHGRSAIILLVPAFGMNVMLAGWLGQQGYIGFLKDIFVEHGYWIVMAGRVITSLSVMGILLPIFIGQGDEDENRFGDPVE